MSSILGLPMIPLLWLRKAELCPEPNKKFEASSIAHPGCSLVYHAGGIFPDRSVFLWHCLRVKHNTVVFIPKALGPSFLQSSPLPWELGEQNLQLSRGCQMAVAAEDSVQYKHRQWCWLNSESLPGAILPSSSQSLGSLLISGTHDSRLIVTSLPFSHWPVSCRIQDISMVISINNIWESHKCVKGERATSSCSPSKVLLSITRHKAWL